MNPEVEEIRSATWSVYYDLREDRISPETASVAGELLELLGRLLEFEITQKDALKSETEKKKDTPTREEEHKA